MPDRSAADATLSSPALHKILLLAAGFSKIIVN